jgi:GNAT superfamily N-acetyltransferase
MSQFDPISDLLPTSQNEWTLWYCRETNLAGGDAMPVEFRRAVDTDVKSIASLVDEVFTEKYGHLFERASPPVADAPWAKSWVAESDGTLVGVGLAIGDWITDVWLKSQFRGLGVGAALLSILEMQVANEGHPKARLRVFVENEAALHFYLNHGWKETMRYPHERWGWEMVNLVKTIC